MDTEIPNCIVHRHVAENSTFSFIALFLGTVTKTKNPVIFKLLSFCGFATDSTFVPKLWFLVIKRKKK